MKYKNCPICRAIKFLLPQIDDELIDAYHESKIGWEDFPRRYQDDVLEIVIALRNIEEKIRSALLRDLDATIEESKHVTIDDVEAFSETRKWIENATLKDFVDEYGVDELASRACLNEEEMGYLRILEDD